MSKEEDYFVMWQLCEIQMSVAVIQVPRAHSHAHFHSLAAFTLQRQSGVAASGCTCGPRSWRLFFSQLLQTLPLPGLEAMKQHAEPGPGPACFMGSPCTNWRRRGMSLTPQHTGQGTDRLFSSPGCRFPAWRTRLTPASASQVLPGLDTKKST